MGPLLTNKPGMLNFEGVDFRDIRFTTFGHVSRDVDLLFIGKSKCARDEEVQKSLRCLQIDDINDAVSWLISQKHNGRNLPKVMVCDTRINDKPTFSAMEKLKSNPDFDNIKLIYLTSNVSPSEMKAAIETGADDYFADDIICHDLLMRVNFLIRLAELKASQYEEPIPIKEDLKPQFWRLKRVFDIAVSFIALLILSPILVLIALAIKIDSRGPVFYISKRAGKGYQIFDFYKFRTMKKDADTQVDQLKHLNQYSEGNGAADSVFFKVKDDPRITKLGSFLRKTSLDEIPQLYNVLKGDMSLVGNRPLPLYEAEKLTQDQWAMRFLAPAGITGLWQTAKRGKESMSPEERVSLDMEYARKNSFWFDLNLIIKTFPALVQEEKV